MDVTRHIGLAAFLFAIPAFAAVEVKQGQDRVDISIDGKLFTTLFYGPNTMKPYIAPLLAPSGKVMTRRWPMDSAVQGETKDHPHHTGMWFTHGDVNGVDFWANVKEGPKFGKVVVDKITTAKGGKNSGEVAFEARWVMPDGKPILRETRRMVFHADQKNPTIDLDITLTAIDHPVKFGDTKEGTFAIRLRDDLTEKSGGGAMTNAAGASKMKSVWGKPSPWVDYSGTLEGEPVGIAIFDHSQNPKHPTTWHSRDYGLFAANPFGDHDFYNDKTKDGSVTIQPGKSLRFRYRVVTHAGDTAAGKVADLYKAWKQ